MADTEIQIAYENGYHDGYQLALSELNGKKFEKITRCKHCKNRKEEWWNCPCRDWADDDFFCASGKPKEGDGNG